MTNADAISKALTSSDLSAGGYLNPEQSTKFIRGILDQPTLLNSCRQVIINGENKKIEKIGFGSRILRAATEGTALSSSDYAEPSFGKVELSTKECIAEVRISYDTLENNIEGANLKNTIMSMIQQRVALDLEELLLNGDTTSADAYLATLNGILKKANTHVVDAAGANIGLGVFTNMINSVPGKYIRNAAEWGIYVSRNTDLAWKNQIAARNTVAGDRFLLENANATALGFQLKPTAMMPEYSKTTGTGNEAVTTTGYTKALFTNPKNIIAGFTRRIQLEQDKDISKREHIIVVTLKVDFALEEADAAATVIDLKPAFTSAS